MVIYKTRYEIKEWCPENLRMHLIKINHSPEFDNIDDAVKYLQCFGSVYYCFPFKVKGQDEFLFYVPSIKRKFFIEKQKFDINRTDMKLLTAKS